MHAFVTSRRGYSTVTLCCMDCLPAPCAVCSESKTWLLGSSSKHGSMTTSTQCYAIFTHWPPVKRGIDFKILTLAFCAKLGQAPAYIKELVVPCAPSRALRPAYEMILRKPAGRLKTCGRKCFALAAASLWNNLPVNFRNACSLAHLQFLLKTHLFNQAFGTTTG